MAGFLLRRVLGAGALLLSVATIVFSILQVVPGDPAELLLTSGGRSATPEAVASLRSTMGLDQPLATQYGTFVANLARLDFGRSIIDGSSIAQNIALRLPRTLELIVAATLLALAVAIPAGTYAALHPGGTFDRVASGVNALLLSVPVFVVGTVFVYLFAQTLGWLPAGGYIPFAASPGGHLAALILPAVSVSLNLMAIIFRMTRGSVLETRSSDWVRTARAKGLPRSQVIRRHILRNSLGPVVTVVAVQVGVLIGSTVLVEYVYNWPGLSGMLVTAVEQRHFPVVQAVIMTVAAIFILINLLVEIAQSVLDPRVKLQ